MHENESQMKSGPAVYLHTDRSPVIGGALLIPYLIWTSFAAYLNYAIMVLNP